MCAGPPSWDGGKVRVIPYRCPNKRASAALAGIFCCAGRLKETAVAQGFRGCLQAERSWTVHNTLSRGMFCGIYM